MSEDSDGPDPGDSGPDSDDEGELGPAEAFEILGDESRVGVLRSLIEAAPDGRSFSELRESVGATDSGRFNYHLQRLVGHFVEKSEEGYSLRYAGSKVAHAVLAGTYNERAYMSPVGVEGECYECSERSLIAEYVDETLTIRCEACGNVVLTVPFPPGAVSSREPSEVPAAFDRWSTRQAGLAADEVCPECASETKGSVVTDVPEVMDHEVLAAFECTVCRRRAATFFGGVALHHPEVLAFHHRHGAYPRTRPYWTVEQIVTDRHTTVVSRDPWRIDVEFEVDDATLVATLDGDCDVVELAE